MERDGASTPLEKMRVTLDLFETALDLQRQNLRRRHPAATEEAIQRLLDAWLQHRPGADHGDGEGCPGARFPQES